MIIEEILALKSTTRPKMKKEEKINNFLSNAMHVNGKEFLIITFKRGIFPITNSSKEEESNIIF